MQTVNVYAVDDATLRASVAVEHCSSADEANLLLQDGWLLVAADIDANGFPLFLLVRPGQQS